MSSKLILSAASLLSNPAVRAALAKGGKAGLRAVGKSRARRARQGKWYMGRSVGIPPSMAPVSVGKRYAAPKSNIRIESGTEMMQTLRITSNTGPDLFWTAGFVINFLDSRYFPRVADIAKTFQKYRVLSLSFDYIPQVPTSYTGQICMAVTSDPTHYTPASFEEAMMLQGSKSGSIWTPVHFNVTKTMMNDTVPKLYCEMPQNIADYSVYRQTSACKLFFSTQASATGTVCGVLKVNYQIEFSDPHLNEEATTTGTYALNPAAAGAPFDCANATVKGHNALDVEPDGSMFRKDRLQAVLLTAYHHGVSSVAPVLENADDSSTLSPSYTHTGTDSGISIWRLPPGRARYRLSGGAVTGTGKTRLVTTLMPASMATVF